MFKKIKRFFVVLRAYLTNQEPPDKNECLSHQYELHEYQLIGPFILDSEPNSVIKSGYYHIYRISYCRSCFRFEVRWGRDYYIIGTYKPYIGEYQNIKEFIVNQILPKSMREYCKREEAKEKYLEECAEKFDRQN